MSPAATKTKSKSKQTYVPRLKQRYDEEIRGRLMEDLGYSSLMQVPRVSKVTLNMGVGEA